MAAEGDKGAGKEPAKEPVKEPVVKLIEEVVKEGGSTTEPPKPKVVTPTGRNFLRTWVRMKKIK